MFYSCDNSIQFAPMICTGIIFQIEYWLVINFLQIFIWFIHKLTFNQNSDSMLSIN